jgi:maltodextrin utilization protein YvdJ
MLISDPKRKALFNLLLKKGIITQDELDKETKIVEKETSEKYEKWRKEEQEKERNKKWYQKIDPLYILILIVPIATLIMVLFLYY